MILYHGSQQIVELPTYGQGKFTNDYGQGFYCTESLELAKEWSCPVQKDGYANKYELDMASLSVLDLNGEGFNILNWLAILLQNRTFSISKNKELALRGKAFIIENFLPDVSKCDIITGYRADDKYFGFAKDFIEGGITVKQLSRAMRLGELGDQVVLMSEKAFENIKFIGYERADGNIYYEKRMEREARAAKAFNDIHAEKVDLDEDLFILDIIRGKVSGDDARLR